MKSEKEKAKAVLKKRERARKGFAEHPQDGRDPLEKQEERQDRIADTGLAVGLGVKR
jgi:hypothetical protein